MLVDSNFFMSEKWDSKVSFKDATIERPIVVMISGGYDPIHIGHLHYIIDASNLNDGDVTLVAVVNGDGFLERKKRYHFMYEHDRAEIVDNIKGVDYTIIWDDGTQYVDGALRLIRPHVFAKGGDRSDKVSMPVEELDACEKLRIKIEFGVGGRNKMASSSELVENLRLLQNSQN